MPKVSLISFVEALQTRFPNLKGYDETRLFSVLMEAGFDVEFGIDEDGTTAVTHPEITDEIAAKLSKV